MTTLDATSLMTCHSSLVSQRNHRIHARSATGWDIASRHGDECEHKGNSREGIWIAGADAEKQRVQQSRECKRCGHAESHADRREPRAFPENQAQHVVLLRA